SGRAGPAGTDPGGQVRHGAEGSLLIARGEAWAARGRAAQAGGSVEMHLADAREAEDARGAVVLVPRARAVQACVGAGPVLDLPRAREGARDVAAEPLEVHLEGPA